MKFSTTMLQDGNNTGIEVPADVVAALDAGKRPPVVVNVNGYEYRSTIAPMGGEYLLPFSADRRKESGIQGGTPSTSNSPSTPRRGQSRYPTICARRIGAVVAKLEG